VSKTALVSELPNCDFCMIGGVTEPAEYDGKTKQGPWGYMCQQHFDQYGVGLGLGLGQKLVLESPEPAQRVSKADELCKRCGKGCSETSWNRQVGRYRVLDNEVKISAMLSLGLYCEEV